MRAASVGQRGAEFDRPLPGTVTEWHTGHMGRRVGINREQIVDAAAAIADRDGLAGVTIARVAASLGVKPPSLYNHVSGLEGVLRQLAQRGAAALRNALVPAAAADDPIRAVAAAYRSFAREHPGLYAAAQRAVPADADPETAAVMAGVVEVVTGPLLALGVAEDRLVDAGRALWALLHGFVGLEANQGFGPGRELDASFDFAVDRYLAGLPAAR